MSNWRRAIAISNISTADRSRAIALCNDGSIWAFMDGGWVECPPIPQPTTPTALQTYRAKMNAVADELDASAMVV